MKILMLHDCAGVGYNLRHKLIERGHEVDLYYFRTEGKDPYVPYENLIPKSGAALGLFIMKKLLEDHEIVHTYNTRFPNHPLPYDYLFSKLRGKKIVVHFHGTDVRKFHDKPAVRYLLRHAKTQIVSTPDLLQYCPSHAVWLPNPVDSNIFKPLPQEPHDSLRVLTYYRSSTPENTEFVKGVVERLRAKGYRIELKIIGLPPVGTFVPHEKMPEVYAWCDVFVNELVLPYQGLTGVEAMLCERPVLSKYEVDADIPRPPVWKTDYESLEDDLEFFYSSSGARETWGQMGREWASKIHDPNKVADKLEEIYDRA